MISAYTFALRALIANRNIPRKLVWRTYIVLATADGRSTCRVAGFRGISLARFFVLIPHLQQSRL